MKKLVALLVMAAMLLCMFAGCSSSSNQAEPAVSTEAGDATGSSESGNNTAGDGPVVYNEGDPLKIAYVGWGFANETSLMYLKEFDLISSVFNVEYELSDAWATSASAEDVVKVLPSMIEAGAQALICHSMSAKIVEICNANKIYFSLSGEVILDEELQKMCDESPYYVGTVALGDYNGGYANAEMMAELGCKNVAYVRTKVRTVEENRLKGSIDGLEKNGINFLGEYCGTDLAQAVRDFVATNPDMDGLIVGNGSSGHLDTCAQTLEALGKAQDIALVSICSPVGHENYFNSGTVNQILAGEGFEPFICSMLLINAMYGHRIDEKPFLDYIDFFPVRDAESITEYSEYFSSESELLPVTAEQVEKDWYKPNNPDLNNAWISNYIANDYNIESMNEAHGK